MSMFPYSGPLLLTVPPKKRTGCNVASLLAMTGTQITNPHRQLSHCTPCHCEAPAGAVAIRSPRQRYRGWAGIFSVLRGNIGIGPGVQK